MTALLATPLSSPLAFLWCWVALFGHFLKMGKLNYDGTRDMFRSEVERKKGAHEGCTKNVETEELQAAHASVNRTIEITQPRLPLGKPLQKRQ